MVGCYLPFSDDESSAPVYAECKSQLFRPIFGPIREQVAEDFGNQWPPGLETIAKHAGLKNCARCTAHKLRRPVLRTVREEFAKHSGTHLSPGLATITERLGLKRFSKCTKHQLQRMILRPIREHIVWMRTLSVRHKSCTNVGKILVANYKPLPDC